MINRIDILNLLIKKHNYKTFLEIGIRDGSCFNAINCETKIGVDPDRSSAANLFMTSDEFFEELKNPDWKIPKTYDLVFVDGMHMKEFVYRDIINSLAVLNEGGTIICHDMLPAHEFGTLVPMRPDHNEWWGDVYLTWIDLRQTRPDLEMTACDTDHGTSLIRKGSQEVIKIDVPITFDNYMQNRKEWMNVLSADLFKQKYLD